MGEWGRREAAEGEGAQPCFVLRARFLVIKSKLCSSVCLAVVSLCLPNDKLLMCTCYNANESRIRT